MKQLSPHSQELNIKKNLNQNWISITELSQLPYSQREKMGINGRNFYYENLSLKIGVSKFISIFKGIIWNVPSIL